MSNFYNVEAIHCSSDPDSLDGVIIRDLGVGIVDGTAPHIIEPTAPGAIEEYVNLGVSWDIPKLTKNKKEILYLESEINSCYPKAYEAFAKALKIHDEWEKIYIDQMDFKKANELTLAVIDEILHNTTLQKTANVKHRFFGASTYKGSVDYLDDLISHVKNRYFIKGRPGSGKSTLLKKLLASAQSRGLDVEVYHCGFDPDSLDMILLPELDTCIFDSTAPHEYFPDRTTDVIVDMYSELITPNTDELYSTLLADISKRYKTQIAEGTSHLSYAKLLHDELEKYYISATDFNQIDRITNDLMLRIDNQFHS